MISSTIIWTRELGETRRINLKLGKESVSIDLPAEMPYQVRRNGAGTQFVFGLVEETVKENEVKQVINPYNSGKITENNVEKETVKKRRKKSPTLTTEQRNMILEEYKKGFSLRKVAANLGFSFSQVEYTIKKRKKEIS